MELKIVLIPIITLIGIRFNNKIAFSFCLGNATLSPRHQCRIKLSLKFKTDLCQKFNFETFNLQKIINVPYTLKHIPADRIK
jgi:hypothetical protein